MYYIILLLFLERGHRYEEFKGWKNCLIGGAGCYISFSALILLFFGIMQPRFKEEYIYSSSLLP